MLSALGDERLATLPDDTWLGPRGRSLSSGEAQRVALARAIASDRPLLVLDEPTANLDAEGEARAIEVLRAAAQQRVLVLVTHRPGPLTLAASQLVLRDELQGEGKGAYAQRKPTLESRTTDG
ncbi:MAG: ATP-binding cassette domain-containing protein [Myxococcales bacterium]|nr:ATP-binding cassette domain-containing protein [Myxococcales bacterium]